MATFQLTLDRRRVKKNGTYPLVFRISLGSKPLFLPTGISVKEGEFDTSYSLVKNSPDLNFKLSKLDNLYRSRFYEYIIGNPNNEDLNALKNYVLNKTKQNETTTISKFWTQEIEKMKVSKRLGGVAIYEQSFKTISQELDLKIPFTKLTFKNLVLLETKLYERGMNANGISVYMRTFRAICNKAIKMDLVSFEWYPFRNFKIKKEKTVPRVLTRAELVSYFKLQISSSSPKYKYWCIGKLLFMFRGINIRDLLLLNASDIRGNRIIYKRAKTGKYYSILLSDEIRSVLSQYTPSDTLLGLVTNELLNSDKKVYLLQQKVKVINKHLADFGKMIGSDEKITTYVFRYSYANLAKKLGFSKDLIAEALGHEYGNSVTGIYLEMFDQDELDKMNDRIIETVVS